MLSEEELQRIYMLLKKAEISQLIALNGLVEGLLELEVKDCRDSLALVLDKYEREAKK